jgi:nucleoporin SEH1
MSVQTNSDLFHDELIHDVEYNFYGDKLASVSSDYKVKVTDLHPDAESKVNDYWKVNNNKFV